MYLPIEYLVSFILTIINFITFWTLTSAGHFETLGDGIGNNHSIIVGRCLKRDKQIICPMDKSPLVNLHMATNSNSSLKLGPNMYYRKIKLLNNPIIHKSYYTKQYDGGNDFGQNVFDLNDEEEHEFMHKSMIDEHVIDDGHQIIKINRGKMEMFIDENKALIRRMFGEHYQYNNNHHNSKSEDENIEPIIGATHYSSFHYGTNSKNQRPKRSVKQMSGNKVDSCESTVEIVTPYWASNSAGEIRAIVNTQHLQQAIEQEVCQAVQTRRCNKDCGCEQKYIWHRLLAYDPDKDCDGIKMDWFLFPSGCVCRCNKY